jgi:DNA repair protein RadC
MRMSIADWPARERPRERLLASGAEALSDAELLAVFFRTGTPGRNAVELARDLISRFGRLSALFGATLAEVREIEGIGEAKYAQLMAAAELSRRTLAEEMKVRDSLASPAAVRGYLRLKLQHLGYEVFVVVFLDAQNRVIAAEELFRGTLTQTSVYPREVVKRALSHNAAGLILAHNHPSGVAEPSVQDQSLTRTLAQALSLIDVRILDHFIVAPGALTSFAERGLV